MPDTIPTAPAPQQSPSKGIPFDAKMFVTAESKQMTAWEHFWHFGIPHNGPDWVVFILIFVVVFKTFTKLFPSVFTLPRFDEDEDRKTRPSTAEMEDQIPMAEIDVKRELAAIRRRRASRKAANDE